MFSNKKSGLIILGVVMLGIFAGGLVLAQGLEVEYPEIGDWKPAMGEEDLLPKYIRYLYNFSIIIAGLIAFFSLVYGGFRYMTSVGSPVAMSDARDQITAGIIGLIIILGSFLLLTTINPQLAIFRLSLIPATCDCKIDLAGQPEHCKEICKEVPGIEYPSVTYTAYEIPVGTLIERVLDEDRLDRIKVTSEDMEGLAEVVQDKAHDLAAELDKCSCSNLSPNAASCTYGEPCPATECQGDPCPGADFTTAKAELLAAAQDLQNYIEGEPLILLNEFKKDITRLEIGRDLIRESIAPINYDNYLEIKELALAMGEEMKAVPFFALGQSIPATKNDPVTFYISEEEFISIQETLPFIFGIGIGPDTLAVCDECIIPLHLTDFEIDDTVKEELISKHPDGRITAACPGGLDCWDYVINWAKNNGWNPAFMLALWGEESGFSREGVALGCLLEGYGDGIVSQLDCFLEVVSNCAPYCHEENTEFCAFMRCYSGGDTCSLSHNPNFYPNFFYLYTRIAPARGPAVPSGNCTLPILKLPPGLAGCPLVPGFYITCGWHGYRRASDGYCHDGIDFGVSIGTPTYAVADGIMSANYRSGLGNYILLYTEYGVFMYAHLSRFEGLLMGGSSPVAKGELIGYTGDTGAPGAPHLHFAYYVDSTIISSNAWPVECLGIECIDEASEELLCVPFPPGILECGEPTSCP